MHMDSKKAQQLLERYWSGQSSLEEERWLRGFFRNRGSEAVDPAAAALFRALDREAGSGELPQDFGRDLPFRKTGKVRELSGSSRFSIGLWWRIAAGLSLVALAAVLLSRLPGNGPGAGSDTFDDPQEAFEAAKSSLLLLSEKLNEGERYTQKIILLNEAENRIKTN